MMHMVTQQTRFVSVIEEFSGSDRALRCYTESPWKVILVHISYHITKYT